MDYQLAYNAQVWILLSTDDNGFSTVLGVFACEEAANGFRVILDDADSAAKYTYTVKKRAVLR